MTTAIPFTLYDPALMVGWAEQAVDAGAGARQREFARGYVDGGHGVGGARDHVLGTTLTA